MGTGEPILDERERLRSSPRGNKRISVNACGELYEELARTKPQLYAASPRKRGIDFEIDYYDSSEFLGAAPGSTHQAPVVCLLHGAPGSYHDFASLIKHLKSRHVRVIAPNFPDYSATYQFGFRHSPRERCDLLLAFFQALQISRLDLLVGHSSAVYTIFELLEQRPARLQVRALGLLSTPSYNLPAQLAATPLRMFTLKLFDYPVLRPLLAALAGAFARLQGIRNRVEAGRIESLLIAASAVGYADAELMRERLRLVHELRLPTFVLLGENDRLIPMASFEQLKRDLRVQEEVQVRRYDAAGRLVRDLAPAAHSQLVEVSQFEAGGHYAFQRFARQLNDDLAGFIARRLAAPPPPAPESTKL